MVHKNEKLALKLLEEHNRLLEKIIKNHSGKIVKFIGDSIFAKFELADNACNSALEIQNYLKERNQICRKDEHINIRIGLHTGIAKKIDDDYFGHDINLTSRIEGVCQSGSVFISHSLFKQIKSLLNFHYRKIEYIKLKNIPKPQTLYKLYPNYNEKKTEPDTQLIELLLENGVDYIDQNKILEYEKKSIGVLIFKSLDNNFYGYGLTNDLINDFDKVNQIYVADIHDVVSYNSSNLDKIDIARKLQVENIINGICRIENKRIFLEIRMFNINSGKILWKEELSEKLVNINLLKGNIIKKVLEIFNINVPKFILDKVLISSTNIPEAYESYQKGLYKIEIIKDQKGYPEARRLFLKALEHDPGFVDSLAQYAITSNKMGFFEEAEDVIDKAYDKSDDQDNDLGKAKVLDSMGIIYKARNKYKKATKCFERALKIQVKYENKLAEAKTLTNLSECYINLQKSDEAIDVLLRSINIKRQLDKNNLLATSYAQLGSAYRSKLCYNNAIDNFRQAMGKFKFQDNEYYTGRVMLLIARCYCDIGDTLRAISYLDQAKKIYEKFDEAHVLGRIYWIYGRISITEKKYKDALSHFKKSITLYNEGEMRKPILDSLLEMILIFIDLNQFDQIPKLLSQYNKIAKKLSDSEKYHKFIDCIIYYLFVNKIDSTQINLNNIEKYLNEMLTSEQKYLGWWILGKAAEINKDPENVKRYYSKANLVITHMAEKIGNDNYKETFLKKHPVSSIINY